MEGIIFLDTSVLIEYFRKKEKYKTFFFNIAAGYTKIAITATTKFEIYAGSNLGQEEFWNTWLNEIEVYSFNEAAADWAVKIFKTLKLKNKAIGFSDISIASVALANSAPLATLNVKHFENIEGLSLVTPQSL